MLIAVERPGLGAAARICHRRDESMSDDQMDIRAMSNVHMAFRIDTSGHTRH